ncbi:MAG: hypothetical protein R3C32_10225 [Chloroflexota bacterium]
MHRRRRLWFCGLVVSVLMAALPALPASAATVRFGAKLTRHTQPTPRETCQQDTGGPSGTTCTWVAVEAFENGGHERAPKDGRIGKVRIITCISGYFYPQVARAKPGQDKARVVYTGPRLDYRKDTQSGGCGGPDGDNYRIQSFTVNMPVKKGDYIAVKGPKVAFIHNSSSGDALVFRPALATGGSYRTTDDSTGGLLIQYQYK